MIKFFRSIRQRLLSENKFSKYLLYAIGEIVLVVIGILIALQINNWNESKKNSKKEFYLLQQLQKEFKKDSSRISTQASLTNLKMQDGKMVKSFLEGKTNLGADSLVSFLFYNSKALLFQSHTPTYDEIISSGNLNLITNEDLKAKISSYKSDLSLINSFLFMEAHEHKERYNLHIYKYFDSEIMTYLWKNNGRKDRIISNEAIKDFKTDINGYKNDSNSIYHVSTLIGVDAELNFQYTQRINIRIYEILDELKKELKKPGL
ncbi:DUF6090 family protein [Flagellimonas okinawensis]|uniref:DUF6090 family protein n=1 Tax=Flagellimonas okinawensis TaxID=3031324 RepID=A0ABT5XIR0_9FLAO|nr:DUF6090 family protein [[Muricauda] okinawensis]MDF0705784.1 DUF6090 family protein [[Muricauda] okinawensis]